MNFQRGLGRDEPEINLIPLIDVLLVVVIFLVITTTYARFAELQIKLPEANGDTAKEVPSQVAIGVDASGHYRVNEIVVPSQDVQSLADA